LTVTRPAPILGGIAEPLWRFALGEHRGHGLSQNEADGRMNWKTPVTEAITPRVATSHCRLSRPELPAW
jgi:hypothetical protein